MVDTAQSGLQKLLSVGNDVRTTQVDRVTQHVQESEPALNNAVTVHCIDYCNDVVINCSNIPASATYLSLLSCLKVMGSLLEQTKEDIKVDGGLKCNY